MPPAFFYGGRFWNTPPGIQQLQFNQLRSHLYPRNPYLAAEAIEEYGEPVPAYLPQRMLNTRWKTPPMRAAWMEHAIGFTEAISQGPRQIAQLEQAQGLPPMMAFWDAPQHLDANYLPATDISPAAPPIARDVLPPDRIQLTPDQLEDLGREQYAAAALGAGKEQSAAERALMEAQSAIDATNEAIYGGVQENHPWFLR